MVQWIIAEVMADHEVDPKDVVTRFRRHSVFGWGTFKCDECRISWSSQITWVTLDIKEQRIRRRFKQKCKKCGQPQRPWWHVEEFAYMMEFALERYQKLVSGTWKPTNRPLVKSDNAPHKSELCERCGFGIRKCWLITGDEKKDDLRDTIDTNSKPKSVSFSENELSEVKEDTQEENTDNPALTPEENAENPLQAPAENAENPLQAPAENAENPLQAPVENAENPSQTPEESKENPLPIPDDENGVENGPGPAPTAGEDNPTNSNV